MMRCMRRALLLASILVLVGATACRKRGPAVDPSQGTLRPVPKARAESGWPLYEVPAEGFALALPPDWRQFDMNPATFEARFQEMLKKNPELEGMHENLRQQVAKGIKFFGLHESTINTGFATNVNVLRLHQPAEAALDMIAADTLRHLEGVPNVSQPIEHRRVKMVVGESERIRVKMTMQPPRGQTVALAMAQFLFVEGTDAYAVTLTTLSDREAHYMATFEKIGQSFRFIK
jgi:hypothetical protein